MQDIAIAHDQFTTLGGAERVALEAARALEAPIYTMAADPEIIPDDVTVREVSGRAGRWAMNRNPHVRDAYQLLAWQLVDELTEADVVLETKNGAWWFVPREEQTVVRYVHSPPRNAYDQFHRKSRPFPVRAIFTVQRTLFQHTVPYASAWVCNSEVVRGRLEKYLGVRGEDVSVVYPPVETETYSSAYRETEGFYLTVGRLEDAKRVGEVIEAANSTGRDLVVAGDGSARERLEELAGPTVEFVGYVSEDEKRELLSAARGFVMNAESEDFGISPVEAFASGTPVLGVAEGYTPHLIVDGMNGHTYERGSLRHAFGPFEAVDWGARESEIEEFAGYFSADEFGENLRDVVRRAYASDTVRTPWETARRVGGDS